MAGKASWDPANRRQKLGLVWKIKRKLAKFLMITFAYRSSSYLFYALPPINVKKQCLENKTKLFQYFLYRKNNTGVKLQVFTVLCTRPQY